MQETYKGYEITIAEDNYTIRKGLEGYRQFTNDLLYPTPVENPDLLLSAREHVNVLAKAKEDFDKRVVDTEVLQAQIIDLQNALIELTELLFPVEEV